MPGRHMPTNIFGDEKFGRIEGMVLDQVLGGTAKREVPTTSLGRGKELIEGLYNSGG